jgi:hypothetical protein
VAGSAESYSKDSKQTSFLKIRKNFPKEVTMLDSELQDIEYIVMKAVAEYEGTHCTSDDHVPIHVCGFCKEYDVPEVVIPHDEGCPVLLARRVMNEVYGGE